MDLAAAVVGCGAIGSRFDTYSQSDDRILTHANACRRHPDVSLVAGVDTDAERREAFAEAWNRPAYSTLEAAAVDHDLDLVCVSTPPSSHETVVNDALATGVRGLLCEKPLTPDEAAAERIVDRCEAADVPLAVNYIRRYAPGIRRLREAVREDEFDAIATATFTFTKGLDTNGTHMVDLGRWLFGAVRDIDRRDSGDSLDAILDHEEATCRLVGTGVTTYSQTRADIYGTAGAVQLVDNGNRVRYLTVTSDPVYPGFSRLTEQYRETTGIHRATYHALADVVTGLRDGEPLTCPGREALETLRVCERLTHSD